jgi:DNA helicase IV
VASPYYRATAANPYGLHRRRRFSVQGRQLVGLFDEVFDDPDHPELALGGGVPDPLLAELDRARAGEMRDIVATIQAEQDEIIRAPLERTVLVQGGPGTGKTAVGLHRAAYLLYAHREVLEGKRVLVVGPNRLFLRYIGAVLPSLGETAVTQHTVETLAGGGTRYRNRGVEPVEVAELKGDPRMAVVLRAVLGGMMRPPAQDVRVETRFGAVTLDAAEVELLVKDLWASSSTYAAGREVVRRRLSALVHRRFFDPATGAGRDEEALGLRGDRAFNALLGRLWPSVSAPALVRRMLGSPSALRSAAAGVLDPGEQQLLQRTMARSVDAEPWTLADLPLLDEAEALVNGVPATYGHAVVDEVQELSAMALRMIARRVPKGSLTVLGDLAQATSAGSQTSWDAIAAHLDAGDGNRAELVTGYRLPAAILDWACRLLPVAAPGLTPPRSVRAGGTAPRLVEARPGDLIPLAAAAVAEVADRWGLVGVIAPSGRVEALRDALRAGGIEVGDDGRASIDRPVTLLGAAAAKGLEFDATVVVEPAAIAAEQPAGGGRGERSLYVALTRCVHELTVVASEPLPAPLR